MDNSLINICNFTGDGAGSGPGNNSGGGDRRGGGGGGGGGFNRGGDRNDRGRKCSDSHPQTS